MKLFLSKLKNILSKDKKIKTKDKGWNPFGKDTEESVRTNKQLSITAC